MQINMSQAGQSIDVHIMTLYPINFPSHDLIILFTLYHHPAVLGLAAPSHHKGPSAVRSSKVEKGRGGAALSIAEGTQSNMHRSSCTLTLITARILVHIIANRVMTSECKFYMYDT